MVVLPSNLLEITGESIVVKPWELECLGSNPDPVSYQLYNHSVFNSTPLLVPNLESIGLYMHYWLHLLCLSLPNCKMG